MADDPALSGSLPADLAQLAHAIVLWVERTLTPSGFSDPTLVLGLVDLGIRVAYERRLPAARHRERWRATGRDPGTLSTIDQIELTALGRSTTIALWTWAETLDAMRRRGHGFLLVCPDLGAGNEVEVPEAEDADGEPLAGYMVVGELPENVAVPYIINDESRPLPMVIDDEDILRALVGLVMDADPGKSKFGAYARWTERMQTLRAFTPE